MDNDLKNILTVEGFPDVYIKTSLCKYNYKDWEYIGSIFIDSYLRRSFAWRINEDGIIEYGIFGYFDFVDNTFEDFIVCDPSKLSMEIKGIIDREEDNPPI